MDSILFTMVARYHGSYIVVLLFLKLHVLHFKEIHYEDAICLEES